MAAPDLAMWKAFEAVARRGGFTAAGRALGVDKSAVSRLVTRLESAVKARLFVRSTRVVRLTFEGEVLLARVGPLLAALDEAVESVQGAAGGPSGDVVLTTTPDLAAALLAPALVAFRLRHPSVRVIVRASYELVNLPGEGVDLAVRAGRPGNASLVAVKLGELAASLYAAPAYLERRGLPAGPEDLHRHETSWPMPARGTRAFGADQAPPPRTVASADFGLLRALAHAGGGVVLLPTFLAADDVSRGVLVNVFPRLRLGGTPLYLVSAPPRGLPARVAALRDHLRQSLRAALS